MQNPIHTVFASFSLTFSRSALFASQIMALNRALHGLYKTAGPQSSAHVAALSSAVPKFTLPDLPYDYGALEPYISGEIMKLHHDKHHATYVNNLNAAMEKYETAEQRGDVQQMIALQSALKFNGGGHVNHSIFWKNLAPHGQGGGGEPTGELADRINKQWGSFEVSLSQKTRAVV